MFLFIHLKHHSILSSFCDSRLRLYLPSPTFSQQHFIFSFIAFPISLNSVLPKFTTVAMNQTESKTLCSALSILSAFCNAPICKTYSNTFLCIIWNPTLYLVVTMATDPDTHLRNFHQDSPHQLLTWWYFKSYHMLPSYLLLPSCYFRSAKDKRNKHIIFDRCKRSQS